MPKHIESSVTDLDHNAPRHSRVMFLSWESPWPAHSGAALRTLGLLKELSKVYPVELLLLTRAPLTQEQRVSLGQLVCRITRIPLLDVTAMEKLRAAQGIIRQMYPYHNSVLETSLRHAPDIREKILNHPGVVLTSNGTWGTIVRTRRARNWILNQCDADVEFWRVYASQGPSFAARLAARINYRLAQRHYPLVYANVGRIISVCEEDRQLTLALAPTAQIDVVENGVDCSYLTPDRAPRNDKPRLLFTGTSAGRNKTALHRFVRSTLPLIQQQIPDVELLVAGNFSQQAQMEFRPFAALRFTGRVEDMRPFFNQSDVFVAPFEETHGSKLKIAEAMAMGMPIVSTPQGIRGFALIDDESVLIGRDNKLFAAQVVRLLNDTKARDRIGAAAREVAETTIDWQVLGKRLIELVEATSATLI